jgi:hypothetical protein
MLSPSVEIINKKQFECGRQQNECRTYKKEIMTTQDVIKIFDQYVIANYGRLQKEIMLFKHVNGKSQIMEL